MSADPDARNTAQSDRMPAAGESSEIRRAARPLGRGLEDVSHVFLQRQSDDGSPRTPRVSRNAESQSSSGSTATDGSTTGVPATKAGTLLLRPSAAVTREHLLTTLKEFTGALEDGLRVIDAGLSCDPFGEIDLLAVDRSSRLAIIDLAATPDDGLMLRGMSHLEWIVRNTANLRRMHQGLVADFSSQPRLFLVAPHFSPLFRSAVQQIADLDIACVRFHGVDVSERVGIFFERVGGGDGE